MNILFIGNFDVDYTTESHHKKTFEKMGHTVIPIQENRSSVNVALSLLNQVDMIYWTHTHSFRLDKDDKIISMLSACRMLKIPTVGYHLDLWMGLEREKDLHNDPYWGIQHFFTVDKLMADWLNENTSTKGYYLPPGVYEDECYIGKSDHIKYPHEIIFTGSGRYHKEYSYRQTLINWLKETYGEKFGHYGGGGLSGLRGDELNNLYASGKIVIGDTLCKDFKYPYYFSDRVAEVCGRGGFMIFPYIRGLELMYDIGREIVQYRFDNFDELKEKIDWYILNDEERERIRLAGHRRAKASHTYTQRLQSLLDTLNLK